MTRLLLRVHGALLGLQRRDRRLRVVTYVPLKVVVALGQRARWWLAVRRRLTAIRWTHGNGGSL